jgi:trypsin
MKFIILLAAVAAANAWDAKKTFLARNEVEALKCKNGKANLANGQEVTLETPNYPGNYPNKAKCNWKIKVPANEEVHIWCEAFDVLKGDFLRIKGVTEKVYGTFEDGIGEILPATSEARTLRVQFRSNKRKNAGGFRCQVAAYAQITGSGSGPVTGTGSGASCITNDGPAAGSACAFPFNYMGVLHYGCTTIDGDTTPWCSTQTDPDDVHVSGVGAWGYCDASCPVQETQTGSGSGPTTGSGSGSTTGSGSGSVCSTTSGAATVGSACAFPFNYMGVLHFGCTTIDGDTTPWCSTQTDANDDHVSGIGAWGYCDASCPVQETAATTTPAPATTAAPGPVVTAAPGTCQCGVKGGAANGRIVGGQETEQHEYPWQVGLVSRNGRSPFCGGTLISSTHVLTAAHCTQTDASSIAVILGEHNIADSDFNRVNVAEIINHPEYNSGTTDNDYAILRLESPVTFTNEVSPACLPADLSNTFAGVLATVTGWGTLSSGGSQPTVLQEVDVTVTTNTACENAYGSSMITANMICAADSGKDSCQGDSGGPMIAPENGRQALIGVVSWGYGCAMEAYPGVYARVTEKMDWIVANTAGTFSSTCTALN